jgi:hypothetical protein
MATAKSIQKKVETRIERVYRATCTGIEISVFDISKVFAVGQKAIAEGVDDAVLGERIKTFVETIRKN